MFKKHFLKEAGRQWDHIQSFEIFSKKVDYVQSSHSNAAGRFLEGAFLKPGDSNIIDTNRTKLFECSNNVEQLKLKVSDEDENIYSADGRRLKSPEFAVHHNFNLNTLRKLHELKCKINTISEKLEELLCKCDSVFGQKRKRGRTEKGQMKKQKQHNKRKAQKRKLKRTVERIKGVIHKLFPKLQYTVDHLPAENDGQISPLDFSIRFECETKLVGLYDLEFSSIFLLGLNEISSLLTVLEKGNIQNDVKSLILDNMPNNVQDKYWNDYEKVYNVNDLVNQSEESSSSSESSSDESV